MRISDWSSDVCSSDLIEPEFRRTPGSGRTHAPAVAGDGGRGGGDGEIVRCSRVDDERQGIRGDVAMKKALALLIVGAIVSGVAAYAASAADPIPETPPAVVSSRRSEEHTSELQSLMRISYAVFCLKKKKK